MRKTRMKRAGSFVHSSALRAVVYRISSELYEGVNIVKKYFEIYRKGQGFDIYHLREECLPAGYAKGSVELAVLRQMPEVHYHENAGVSWFYFLDGNGRLQLGGSSGDTSCVVSDVDVERGIFYPIAPFVVHAAGPSGRKTTRLLILNPSGLRQRPFGTSYTEDTRTKEQVLVLPELA